MQNQLCPPGKSPKWNVLDKFFFSRIKQSRGNPLSCVPFLYYAPKQIYPVRGNYVGTERDNVGVVPPRDQISYYGSAAADDTFAEDYAKHRIPLTVLQRGLLIGGAAAISFFNPYRGDMIACLGETTGSLALVHCREKMLATPEGRRILAEKPRIHSSTVDLSALKELPVGTVGRTYRDFLDVNNVSPDSRPHVRFVEDTELAYVMQRYRETHDIFHAILLMPTTMLGEVSVKWIEALQFRFPMCFSGAIFGAYRLRPRQRKLYTDHYLPWAINTGTRAKFLLGIYFEERWEQSLADFHREMNIVPLVEPARGPSLT